MVNQTIHEIEERLATAPLTPERRAELMQLLDLLKKEVESLAKTHGEEARSIEGFTNLSAHEATRQEKNPELLRLSLDGLSSSVQGFEETHPKLVEVVNRVAVTLANLGI